jgi:hypothetical protein
VHMFKCCGCSGNRNIGLYAQPDDDTKTVKKIFIQLYLLVTNSIAYVK